MRQIIRKIVGLFLRFLRTILGELKPANGDTGLMRSSDFREDIGIGKRLTRKVR